MGEDFDYAEEFETLDVEALKQDVIEVMTTSQDWWPADYGHYGPLFIRMTWHAAGTYRIADGRGGGGSGAQRFAPLNSWPDNANLDKARRLLWPVKQKYGRKISWADLLVFAGNCAMESMGFKTFGFGFGREDIWEPEEIFWGPEDTWLGDERYSGDRELAGPLGAVQMGLIYVNPEGPNGNPDPLAAARDIRETFARMAMNDEETVALIVGGHTFGKCHGAGRPRATSAPSPRAAPSSTRASAGRTRFGSGKGVDAITSGLEGAWTNDADEVGQRLPRQPVRLRVGADDEPRRRQAVDADGPGGPGHRARRPRPVEAARPDDADDRPGAEARPDLRPIAKRFHENPDQLADAFAKAWYKLLHRDMGPVSRYLGPWVPEPQLWQDPVPAVDHELVGDDDIAALKAKILGLGPVRLAAGRHRVGVGGQLPRHRQARRRQRRADPPRAAEGLGGQRARPSWPRCCRPSSRIQQDFNGSQSGGTKVSLADLIVLGGCAAVEQAAKDAGHDVTVPFAPGRTDASQEQTDVESFAVLEPTADGFRNYLRAGEKLPPETLLLDRANLLTLTAPEMTVLVGGMRALDANVGQTAHGVFTDRPGTLTNDFFVNLLDMGTEWKPSVSAGERLRGPRPGHRRGQVDRHRRRPRLRLELPAPGPRRGLRVRRREGEVRARLRGRVGQGHEPRPLRPGLIDRRRSW